MPDHADDNADENVAEHRADRPARPSPQVDRRGRKVVSRESGAARLPRGAGGRRHVITVRVNDAEYEAIAARAIVARVSKQRLMVEAATADPAASAQDGAGGIARHQMTASERRALVVEFLGAKTLVARLGVNINQLAKTANATGELPAELQHAAAAAERALDRLAAAVDALTT
ncbi:plasmid mobilization relaxosome protein MobC [Actinomadura sp. 6N118]|uniref:plasmid mobilization relaxosome protein MobC n=1 Tax=Actinomadura sp. 6N118 TaxID=3375151 RepID=UPI00379A2E62